MSEKINILFVNGDKAGVNYYRTLIPAKQIQKQYTDEFYIEINPNPDFNDIEYLKKFHIIHFHRTLDHTYQNVDLLHFKLSKKLGIKLVMDIDDYWALSEHHPLHHQIKNSGLDAKIKHNISISDYVTTTTSYFASEIAKINKNVHILPNAIDPNEGQWNYDSEKDYNMAKFGILCGSSHLHDLTLLAGVTDKLENTSSSKGKFKYYLVGYDLRGTHKSIEVNEDFVKAMQNEKLWTKEAFNILQQVNFDLSKTNLPDYIKQKFNGKVLTQKERKLEPKETVWYKYEEILRGTNNNLNLSDDYVKFLDKFEDKKFDNVSNERFERHYTKHYTTFGNNYKLFNVGLAPIKDFKSPYNRSKSNLKIVENGFHKNAVIVSEIDCYDEIEHGKNGLVVPKDRPQDWFKAMKKLASEPNMIKDLGESLYEYVSDKYDINKSIKDRVDFYKEIVNK